MFCVPPLLLTAPDAAAGLLGYRTKRIDGARMNAATYGRAGVQFPGESGARFGEEFAERQAWPILRGVAQWIADRVERTSRGFEIRGTTGAHEQHRNIDNDAMVNM